MHELSHCFIALHKGCSCESFQYCWIVVITYAIGMYESWLFAFRLPLNFFAPLYFESILTPLFCCGVLCYFLGLETSKYMSSCFRVEGWRWCYSSFPVLCIIKLFLLLYVTLGWRTLCLILLCVVVERLIIITLVYYLLYCWKHIALIEFNSK